MLAAPLTTLYFFLIFPPSIQYVTLDDIMDLMGSDAVQGEEALRKMWKESLNDCNCSAARITYDDFVLIMKGQTREFETEIERTDSGQKLSGAWEHAVDEVEKRNSNPKLNKLSHMRKSSASADDLFGVAQQLNGFSSVQYKPDEVSGLDLDSPLSMDDEDDMPMSTQFLQPNHPPSTPNRTSVAESKTPQSLDERIIEGTSSNPDADMDAYMVPQLPKPSVIHTRGKSRSFDEREMKATFKIDVHRAIALPEHDQKKSFVSDKQSMSALQVNRQLYRSHRQMRLSVIDACKRFEEQQERRARGVLLAEKNQNSVGGFAGLVMRRVENKTVSSEEVKNLLEKNRMEQQKLMEKANKRSGGRRSRRKKTVSDISTMMCSMSSEEITKGIDTRQSMVPPVIETKPLEFNNDDANFRSATVPGEFRKVNDPFGSHGKYAAIMSSN